jgi:hypothetical protein
MKAITDSSSVRVETAMNLAEMARRLSVGTVPAVWPGGVSHRGTTEVSTDRLAPEPDRPKQPPLMQAKRP